MSRPGLWERLSGAARVTVLSVPPGSGKTVLLRSWIGESGLGERAAWVVVGRDESAPEIAGELSVSPSTVKTHMRNLYAKLDGHSRAEAVERARALGLLAPSAHR